MPHANVYIRKENWAKWVALEKSKWVNEKLEQDQTIKVASVVHVAGQTKLDETNRREP